MTAVPKVQNIASKEVERRSKEEREILQRPADDESEDEVDFISWEIYKENLKTVGKEKHVKMSHQTTRQAASQVLEVMKGEKVENLADAGQSEIEPRVPYTVEQCQLLAEVESWEEDAEPGLHVELLPASKELMAEVEAWGHKDEAEANISEQSCAPKGEAEEAGIVMKALAEEDCRAEKLASSAACDDRERDELIADIWMEMNRKAEEEMMAALEMVQEKKEQYKEVPLMQVEGVYGMKGEAETMVDKMHSTLKEEKVTRGKKEWHEISPLVADKLLPPDREGSWAVGGVRG